MFAAANLADRLSVDVQGAQSLKAQAASGDPEALRSAARQFEAMVVQTMLKTMRETSFAPDGDVLGESQGLKMYRELLDQQWAQKMVTGKGFGFAEMMVKAMEARNKAVTPEEMARLALPEGDNGTGNPVPAPAVEAAPAVPAAAVAPAASLESGSAKAAAPSPSPAQNDYRQAFLDRLRPHAERVAAETGLPAQFILAHAALETGWGRHEIRNADGSSSHNLFGIKAGRGWSAVVAQHVTTEHQYVIPLRKTEPFRAYGSDTEALRDYADLLGKRYQGAYRAPDAVAFAQGLADGGYATDPNYAGKIKGVIASVAALEA
ncbi:MAG: flagellar assembly peptidoglycan hydrolase FlgJ [Gallionellaceae bacterium]|nr:flagellar assembly peptidoglycan hydrolase FlgJ [Gallionellaceae bacterium]